MSRWLRFARVLFVAALVLAAAASKVRADGEGQTDLDEALKAKVTAEGLGDLNKVIELLESSLDKGLDVENSDFAEQMLSQSLFERASQLASVVSSVPEESLSDVRIQRVRALAVSDLRRVMTYDSAPAEATAMLAELLALPGGDREEALKLLDKFIDSDAFAAMPKDEQIDSIIRRAALQTEAAKAMADFARAVEIDPSNADARLARAQYQFDHDNVDDALADVAAIVEKTPDLPAAYLLQAQILRTVKRYDEALKCLDKVAELAPKSPLPEMSKGEIYREQGEYEKAIAAFTRVLDMQPGLELALIRRAEANFFAEKFDDALADVDAVLKKHPDMALAHGLRAQVLAGKRQLGEAIAEMKKVVEEMPGQSDVRMHLALYYQLNDQPREAIDEYSSVLEIDADNFLALRSRGDCYLTVGDHASAIADFDRALKIEPEDSALLNNLAWVLSTSPDDALRDGERAVGLAAKACELTDYKKPHILSTLAAAYAESDNFDKAREWSQKSVDLSQSNLEVAIKGDDKDVIKELTEMTEQLGKELANYKENKPVRERQTLEGEKPSSDSDKPAKEGSSSSESQQASGSSGADESASSNDSAGSSSADSSSTAEAAARK